MEKIVSFFDLLKETETLLNQLQENIKKLNIKMKDFETKFSPLMKQYDEENENLLQLKKKFFVKLVAITSYCDKKLTYPSPIGACWRFTIISKNMISVHDGDIHGAQKDISGKYTSLSFMNDVLKNQYYDFCKWMINISCDCINLGHIEQPLQSSEAKAFITETLAELNETANMYMKI